MIPSLCQSPSTPAGSSHFGAGDQAYREYCRRRDAGEAVDVEELCQACPPGVRTWLRRTIEVHLYLEEKQEPIWPEPGDHFLGFLLLSELASGGAARVFLATEPALGSRIVVVKVSKFSCAEAEILGPLDHPNIVPVHSVRHDPEAGLTAICMPYHGDITLGKVIEEAFEGPGFPARAEVLVKDARECLPPGTTGVPRLPAVLRRGTYVDGVRHVGAQLADALDFIHQRGVFHRDLKPSNVLMAPAGQPMLLDFNLSAAARDARAPSGGTPPYMPPEQLPALDEERRFDPSILDARSDIFSLGAILYELLSGKKPFGSLPANLPRKDIGDCLLARQRLGPRPLGEANPDVDAPFARLVESCLAFDPQDRPASAAALAAALRRDLAPGPRARRWLGKHPRTLCGTLFLLFLAVFASALFFALRPPLGVRQLKAGEDAYHQGRYHEAVDHFSRALEAEPTLTRALFARGRAYQQWSTSDESYVNLALADFQLADKQRPDGRSKACIGYCFNRLGNPRAAIFYYRQAIEARVGPPEVLNNLGFSHMVLRELEAAAKSLDQALRDEPGLQATLHNRARLSQRRAQVVLQKIEAIGLEGAGASHTAVANQGAEKLADGLRLELTSYLEKGLADVRRALEHGPGSPELYYDAARLGAMAAANDPRWLAPTLDYLEPAIALGVDPRQLSLEKIFAPLRSEPLFKDLTRRPSPRQPLPRTLRLVDPVTNPPANRGDGWQ